MRVSLKGMGIIAGSAIALVLMILWVTGLAFGSTETADQSVAIPLASTPGPSVTGDASSGGLVTSGASSGSLVTGGDQMGAPSSGVTAPRLPVDFRLVVRQTQAPKTSVLLNARARVFLNAQLANHGYADAHNTRVYVRARIGDSYIAIDGKNAYVVEAGTVAAGQTVQRDASFELQMSLAQGNQAQRDGITFEIVIGSDERNQALAPWRCTAGRCVTQ